MTSHFATNMNAALASPCSQTLSFTTLDFYNIDIVEECVL